MSFEHYMQEDQFGRLLGQSGNQAGLCILLVLAWMAASDDDVDEEETGMLRELAVAWGNSDEVISVIGVARSPSNAALSLAFSALRQMEPKMRLPFIELAITMALSDGKLTPGESHTLRLIADVLEITPASLNTAFHGITGSDLPPAGDLGSADWWSGKREPRSNSEHRKSGGSGHRSGSPPDMARLRALTILGLDEESDKSEIRSAYRRMAKVHHPDRFASLGEEAVKAAEASFRRIKEAHDFLMQS